MKLVSHRFYFILLTFSMASAQVLYDVWEFRESAFDRSQIKRIAVLPFRNYTTHSGVGAAFSDAFISRLAASEAYEVIDRENLGQIFSEQSLSQTGAIDDATAVEVGKLKGIDALIAGKITACTVNTYTSPAYGSSSRAVKITTNTLVNASLRVLSARNGSVVWSKSTSKSANDVGYEGVQQTENTPQNQDALSQLAGSLELLNMNITKPKDPQWLLQETIGLAIDDLFWDLVPRKVSVKRTADELAPFMGVETKDLLKDSVSAVSIVSLVPGEAAEKAGLMPGDIIFALNDKRINSGKELIAFIRSKKAFETIQVTIIRPPEPILVKKKIKLGYYGRK